MRKGITLVFVAIFALISASAFAESKGLSLGGLDKDAKKAQIEAKKSTEQAQRDVEKAKKDLENKKKEMEKEAKKQQKSLGSMLGK